MSVVMPGLEDKFCIPRKQDDQELRNTARAALAEAVQLKAEFLRREVPESVFQDMEANLAAFETALTGQNTGKEERVTAGASIDAAIDRGTDALRQLDPIVRNKLHNNSATLAAWLSAGAPNAPRAATTPTHHRRPNPPTSNHQPPGPACATTFNLNQRRARGSFHSPRPPAHSR